jgi:hypothetical protein
MLVCSFFAGNSGFVQMPGGCFVTAVNIATSPWILCFTFGIILCKCRAKGLDFGGFALSLVSFWGYPFGKK